MTTMIKEITTEEYEELKALQTASVISDYIADIAVRCGYHPAGYGFWNATFYTADGKYYVKWQRQDSCD